MGFKEKSWTFEHTECEITFCISGLVTDRCAGRKLDPSYLLRRETKCYSCSSQCLPSLLVAVISGSDIEPTRRMGELSRMVPPLWLPFVRSEGVLLPDSPFVEAH